MSDLDITSLEGLKQRITDCNKGLSILEDFKPFLVEGKHVGAMPPQFAQHLERFPTVFNVQEAAISLQAELNSVEARTEAVAGVLEQLKEEGVISGWRDEMYPVLESFHAPPLLCIERAAAKLFGIKAYGVHVNGIVTVEGPDGVKREELWVGRRSPSKQTWPGKLDHIVAGGQPHGLSPKDNVVKECAEEAGIPAELALKAQPAGAISYQTASYEKGLSRDVLFCYDIHLPADFVPVPQDGEVSEFMRWPMNKVASTMSNTTDFKPNVCVVIIDMMIRRGHLSPEQDGYLDILSNLRVGDCS